MSGIVPPQYTPSISISPEIATNYILTGYNQIGCSDSASQLVEVGDTPNISLSDDKVSMTVITYPEDLVRYEFYLNEAIVQNGTDNTWYYGDMGLLSDSLIVIGYYESYCSDSDNIFIELTESSNAFTPNGDGINDLFREGHDIVVFSSWGGEIFKGDKGWDGKYNGSLVTPGTYYYIQHVYNLNGEIIKTIKGSVTVVLD